MKYGKIQVEDCKVFYREAGSPEKPTVLLLHGFPGVTVFDKEGRKITHFPIPEEWTANVCFGGKERNTLFITASKSIYTLKMLVHGVK